MANKISGYLVTWGGPDNRDLDGEFFSPDTDFGGNVVGKELPIKEYPMQWFSNNDPRALRGESIGTARIVRNDSTGLWIEGQLDESKVDPRKIKMLHDMQHNGIRVSFAAEAMTDMEIAEDGSIKRFNLIGCSITPAPATPNTKLSIDTAEE